MYTTVGYTVQTDDSGEEALPKGAIKTRQLKRNRTEPADNVDADDIDDDGKYIFRYVFLIASVIKSIQFM